MDGSCSRIQLKRLFTAIFDNYFNVAEYSKFLNMHNLTEYKYS